MVDSHGHIVAPCEIRLQIGSSRPDTGPPGPHRAPAQHRLPGRCTILPGPVRAASGAAARAPSGGPGLTPRSRTQENEPQVMSASTEPQLAGRQPSTAVGCPG
ncbi:hypothetical protein KFL01_10820 [Kocuria flava]|uniref:Uncharacterized protein n=1 Tax=Kocuria flava TaxID=446860 RepID=A0ABQ0X2B0_9MICC|nr:hypothetical protein KFL01_10820 [Kocuria flava]